MHVKSVRELCLNALFPLGISPLSETAFCCSQPPHQPHTATQFTHLFISTNLPPNGRPASRWVPWNHGWSCVWCRVISNRLLERKVERGAIVTSSLCILIVASIGQYARYASTNQPYPAANHGNSLGIPHPYSNNASHHAGSIGGYTSASSSAYNTTTPNMTSPYSTTSSPGYNSPNVSKQGPQPAQLKKYTLQPPPRQLPLSKTMPSLGYPDIYPQRPDQDEDILTPSNVRNGFVDKAAVSVSPRSAKLEGERFKFLDLIACFLVRMNILVHTIWYTASCRRTKESWMNLVDLLSRF